MVTYLKAFTAKGGQSHLMIDGVEHTLCGIRLSRIENLEPTEDEPGCMTCFRAMNKPDGTNADNLRKLDDREGDPHADGTGT